MLRRFGIALASAVGGYVIGAFAGWLLVAAFSSNQFDKQMEEGMTAVFVTGPLAAVIAFIAGFALSGRSRAPADALNGQSTGLR